MFIASRSARSEARNAGRVEGPAATSRLRAVAAAVLLLGAGSAAFGDGWVQKLPQGDAGSPSARESQTMVWDGTRVIMFGGGNPSPPYRNDLWWYDPTTNTWTEKIANGTPGSPVGRLYSKAVWDGTHYILFGGSTSGSTTVNDLWWYDPATNTWTEKIANGAPGAPQFSNVGNMVWDGTRVIAFAGYYFDTGTNTAVIKNDLWWYDPATNTWTEKIHDGTAGSPAARTECQLVWNGSRAILFGGANNLGGWIYYNDLWWYDPATNTWTEKIAQGAAGSPPSHNYGGWVWDGTRCILFGGSASGSWTNDLWWYDPTTNSWAQRIANGDPGSPAQRNTQSFVWDGTRAIMFAGAGAALYNDTWWYTPDPVWVQKFPSSSPAGRWGAGMVWDGTRFILFGGYQVSGPSFNDLWWYEPVTNTWTQKIAQGTPGSPASRAGHGMVWDGTRVILYGGNGFSDLWWYDPGTNTWTQKIADAAPGSPVGRSQFGMTWDGSNAILFGGWSGTHHDDLWWYNPGTNAWTEKIPQGTPGSPPARGNCGMTWDGTQVVLFGGNFFPPTNYNDVWWYDPGTNAWTVKIADGTPGSPPKRTEQPIVWDGSRVILFGGYSHPLSISYNDTWCYAPGSNSWTERIPNGTAGSPPVRRGHYSMAWDGARVILFGGEQNGSYPNDTWWYTSSDATAATVGTVNDGPGADIDVQSSTTTISANWSGFSDVESGVAGYAWAIGTTSGGADTQPFTGVGAATSASNSALTLNSGTTYFVTVRATNGAGLVSSTVTSDGVKADSTAPSVTTTSLVDATVGAVYRATLAATDATAITWSIASGTLPAGLTLGTDGVISGTPTAAGTANFTVRVTDAAGHSSDQALTLAVSQPVQPSVTGLSGSTIGGVAPLPVTFTGSATSGAPIASVVWNFGDGSQFITDSVTGVQHTFMVPGTYMVTLTVTDNLGQTATRTTSVTVTAPPGAATVTLNASAFSGVAPLSVAFAGTAHTSTGTFLGYEWDFDGDGAVDFSSPTSTTAEHVYTAAGTYTARFRAIRSDGTAEEATASIVVGLPAGTPPTLAAGPTAAPNPAGVGRPVAFTATGTVGIGASGTTLRYLWDFDGDGIADRIKDGNSGVADAPTFTYNAPGTYPAGVRILDLQADGSPRLSADGAVNVTVDPPTGLRVFIVQPKGGETLSGNHVTANVNAVPASQADFTTVQLQFRLQGNVAFTAASTTGEGSAPPSARLAWDVSAAGDNLAPGTYELRALVRDTLGTPYASDDAGQQGVVTVQVSATPAVDENKDGNGRVKRQVAFDAGDGADSLKGGGQDVEVRIPAGGIGAANATLTIEELAGNPETVGPKLAALTYHEIGLSGGAALTLPADVEFTYADDDGNGVVDGTSVATSGLKILHYNAAHRAWEELPGQTHDTERKRVVGRSFGLSPFVLGGPSSGGSGGDGGGVCFLEPGVANAAWPVAAGLAFGLGVVAAALCRKKVRKTIS